MSVLKTENGFVVPDYSKIKPSDMLFAVTLDGCTPDGEEICDPCIVIMTPREYWEKEGTCYDDDVDYDWVDKYVPPELDQVMEANFSFEEAEAWPSIKEKLVAAGFVEEPKLWNSPPG